MLTGASRVASAYPSKRLKDPAQHLLGDVEVQRADVEPHGARVALLQVVGERRRPVLLRLHREPTTHMGQHTANNHICTRG